PVLMNEQLDRTALQVTQRDGIWTAAFDDKLAYLRLRNGTRKGELSVRVYFSLIEALAVSQIIPDKGYFTIVGRHIGLAFYGVLQFLGMTMYKACRHHYQ